MEELLAHLLDAEAAGVAGWHLAVESVLGAVDDLRLVASGRRRNGLPPLMIAPIANFDAAVALSCVLVAISYAASLAAAFTVPHHLKIATLLGAGVVLFLAVAYRLVDRVANR